MGFVGWWMALGWTVVSTPVVDAPAADRTRIQQHLRRVEADLRAAPPPGLTAEQRAARSERLDALHEYWTRGLFPRNEDFLGQRRPYFVDAYGTACAVGHLMIESGAADLAAEIRERENNALVYDIRTPGVVSWATASGLAVGELARIQPNYCFCDPRVAPVCGVNGVTYGNACVATRCAGVEIDHDGPCVVETGSDWPAPMGTTGTGTTATGTGTSGSGSSAGPATDGTAGTTSASSSGAAGTHGGGTTGGGGDRGGGDGPRGDDGGCAVGRRRGGPVLAIVGLLGLLAGTRRRRGCAG